MMLNRRNVEIFKTKINADRFCSAYLEPEALFACSVMIIRTCLVQCCALYDTAATEAVNLLMEAGSLKEASCAHDSTPHSYDNDVLPVVMTTDVNEKAHLHLRRG